MNMMNDVLSDYLDDFVLVFLDDILIYSRTVEIHAESPRESPPQLYVHIACISQRRQDVASWKTEVEFLGQWITPQGDAPLKQNMKAVVEWEAPQDLKGVRSFLGLPTTIAALYKDIHSWHPH